MDPDRHGIPGLAAMVARQGLPGGRGDPPVGSSLSTRAWDDLLSAVDRHRLSGLALRMAASEQLLLSESRLRDLTELQRRWMATSLVRERAAIGLVERFAARGLDVLVLKGPAVAHRFYDDPSARPFGDVDLLVRGTQWEAGLAVLAEAGYGRVRAEPRPAFDRRFGKAAVHRDDDGIEVDLHRTLVLGPFGLWIQPDELFDHADTVQVGGTPLPCLDPTASFLHACVHAALGTRSPQLHALRDIAQIDAHGRIETDVASDLVRRWNLGPVVRHALEQVETTLGYRSSLATRRLGTVPVPRRAERALAAYTTDARGRGGTARATLAALPRLGDKVAFVRALLVPHASFLSTREGSSGWGALVRRWRRAARWLTTAGGEG